MSEKDEKIDVENESSETLENENNSNCGPVELTKISSDEKSYIEVVEEQREIILKDTKRANRISVISGLIFIVLMAASFIFIGGEFSYMTFILLGAAVVVLLASSIIVKRIARPDPKKYVLEATKAIGRFTYDNSKFSDCTYDYDEKIVFGEIANDGIYANAKECVSRFVVNGKFNGRSFKSAELGIYQPAQKRGMATEFVGKYLTYPNDLHFVDRIVIVSKGATDIDLPNGIDDLVPAVEGPRFTIYAPANCKIKDVLSSKFIDAIKAIEVKDHLLTLSIVIWAGRSVVYASYDEETVTLPMKNPIVESCFTQYRDDLLKELDALHMLIKE